MAVGGLVPGEQVPVGAEEHRGARGSGGGREGGRETRSARSRKAGPGRLGRVRSAGTWGSLRATAKCHDSVRPEVSPGRSSVRPRGGSFDGRKTRPLTAGVRLGLAAGDAASGWPPDGGDLRCDGGGERKAALSLRPAAAVGRPAECVRVCVWGVGAQGEVPFWVRPARLC